MKAYKGSNMTAVGKSAFDAVTGFPIQTGTTTAGLKVVVLYTTSESTKEALQYAAGLGDGLNVNVNLIDIQVVPYACSLNRPPIDPEFSRQRLEKLVMEAGIPVHADVVYARDRDEILMKRLSPESLVLMPAEGFLARFSKRTLMRKLIEHGHDVVLIR